MRRLLTLIILLAVSSAAFAASTWEARTSGVGTQLNDVVALDHATAIAVGEDRTIIKTTNYGATWTSMITTIATSDLNAISFTSTATGFAAGQNATGLGTPYILKTTDGGNNWTVNLNAYLWDVTELFDIQMVGDQLGFACGSRSPSVDPGLIKTTNGGSTWSVISAGSGLPGGYTYYGVHFIDANTGWIVGSSGKVYKTINGGANWTAQTSGVTETLNDVFFINSTTGWIVGNQHNFGTLKGLVLKTTDGGTNWKQINSGVDQALTAVHFAGTGGWATGSGNSGIVIKSIDGGTTWTTDAAIAATTAMLGLYMNDTYNGYAAGGSGAVYRLKTDPTITSIAPATASQGDTLNVVIKGTNFLSGLTTASLVFSATGVTVNSLTVDSSTQITANITIALAAPSGLRSITLTNPDTGSVVASNACSINPFGVTPPTLTGITINGVATGEIGRNADRTIVLAGTNFLAGPTVTFGSDGITINSQTNNATTITLNVTVSATAVLGQRPVSVANTDGGITTADNLLKVNAAPGISSITPLPAVSVTSGFAGTTDIRYTVRGTDFQSGAAVSFTPAGMITVNSVTFVSDQELVVSTTIPAGATIGNYGLTVTNQDGGNGSAVNLFSVSPQSTIPVVNPTRTVSFPYLWNPATGPITFQFDLNQSGQYYLNLYTIDGRKAAGLDLGTRQAGLSKITWAGGMNAGGHISSGIFVGLLLYNNQVVHKFKVMVQR